VFLSSFKYVAKAIDFDVRNQLGTALRVSCDMDTAAHTVIGNPSHNSLGQ